MIVVKHGPREMQLAWTHLLPATFGGRARMNVQNALAAAAAAFAAGAPLHDIRQGLRTFSTNYYLSPGRLNEVEVNGVNVIVDYCHNAPGMRMLGDFVDRVGDSPGVRPRAGPARRGSASSPPPATAATRTCASSAHIAAQHFDVVVVREDVALRGRERGEVAGPRRRGRPRRDGRRARAASRSRRCSTRSRPSGTRWPAPTRATWWCICVDKHAAVMAELENWSPQAQAGAGVSADAPAADPDYQPAVPVRRPERLAPCPRSVSGASARAAVLGDPVVDLLRARRGTSGRPRRRAAPGRPARRGRRPRWGTPARR